MGNHPQEKHDFEGSSRLCGAYVMLVGAVSLLEGEDGGLQDAAILFEAVRPRGEAQDGLVIGWQA